MQTILFRIGKSDIVKAFFTAIVAAILVTVGSVVMQNGFDVFAANWTAIFHSAVNSAVVAGFSYLVKNFVSDQTGAIFGMVGGAKQQ